MKKGGRPFLAEAPRDRIAEFRKRSVNLENYKWQNVATIKWSAFDENPMKQILPKLLQLKSTTGWDS